MLQAKQNSEQIPCYRNLVFFCYIWILYLCKYGTKINHNILAGLKSRTCVQMVIAQNHTRDTKNRSPSKYHQITSTCCCCCCCCCCCWSCCCCYF